MKSPVKILLIIFAFLQLIFVTYLSLGAIPVKIENETTGDMYSFEKISFNLSSNEYQKDPKPVTVENREEGRSVANFSNTQEEQDILISEINDVNYIEVFNKILRRLQSPFKNRFVVRNMKKDIKEGTPAIGLQDFTVTEIEIKVYKGVNKAFILNKTTLSDNSTHYSAEGKVSNHYYHITLLKDADPENIYEFMRSVTLR